MKDSPSSLPAKERIIPHSFHNGEQRRDYFRSHRCCVSAYISVVIFTASLKPSRYASRSDRAISDSWQFSICSSFSFCCSVVSIDRSSSSNLVISDCFFLVPVLWRGPQKALLFGERRNRHMSTGVVTLDRSHRIRRVTTTDWWSRSRSFLKWSSYHAPDCTTQYHNFTKSQEKR